MTNRKTVAISTARSTTHVRAPGSNRMVGLSRRLPRARGHRYNRCTMGHGRDPWQREHTTMKTIQRRAAVPQDRALGLQRPDGAAGLTEVLHLVAEDDTVAQEIDSGIPTVPRQFGSCKELTRYARCDAVLRPVFLAMRAASGSSKHTTTTSEVCRLFLKGGWSLI